MILEAKDQGVFQVLILFSSNAKLYNIARRVTPTQ